MEKEEKAFNFESKVTLEKLLHTKSASICPSSMNTVFIPQALPLLLRGPLYLFLMSLPLACCTPFSSASILSYMVSCLASLCYKISSEVSDIAVMMRSMSSIVSTVCILGLLALDFFHDEGFMGETFLFLDVSASSMGSLGCYFTCFFLSSSPFSSSLSTSSPPPPPGESEAVSSDALFNSCTSSFFFLLLLLGASYSSASDHRNFR
jgi:hypothetical protein